MLPVKDAYSLPLLYHLNSEPWLNIEAYNDPTNEVQFKQVESAAVPLPPAHKSSALNKLLQARHSCRQFKRQLLRLDALSEILAGAYGIQDILPAQTGNWGCTRPAPSAGGLYPLEIYLALADVEGAADGVYHYNVLRHSLETIASELMVDEIGAYLLEQHFLRDANAILFLSAVFRRTLKKYGPRGYRYVLLEAGHVAQNISLLAVEHNLGVLSVGGFYDSKLNRTLDLDGRNEAVIYCIALGFASTTPTLTL